MSNLTEIATPDEVARAEALVAHRARRTLFVDEAEESRQNPGVWLKFRIVGVPGPRHRAYQIGKGILSAFQPEGAFLALPSGRDHVLVKFIGDTPEAAPND